MSTLHDMFRNDFSGASIDQEVNYQRHDVDSSGTAQLRVFRDQDDRVTHVIFYISEGEYSPDLFAVLLAKLPALVQDPDFTGRVTFYVDALIPPNEQEEAITQARGNGFQVKFRDQDYRDFINDGVKPYAFVCHDSRDRVSLVRPLIGRLGSIVGSVWHDEFALRPGDSLRRSLEAGLTVAPRCILVLSRNFFGNPGWTKSEFTAAINDLFSSGGSVLVPVWHGVDRPEVAAYSPLISDVAAVDSGLGLDELARRLGRALKP